MDFSGPQILAISNLLNTAKEDSDDEDFEVQIKCLISEVGVTFYASIVYLLQI